MSATKSPSAPARPLPVYKAPLASNSSGSAPETKTSSSATAAGTKSALISSLASSSSSKLPQSRISNGLKKAETLNPRFLKSSPASFETRFKLLKLLHQEFVRLNNDLKKEAKNNPEKVAPNGGTSNGEAPQGFTDLILTDQELIWRALDDEEKTAADKPTIYSNSLKNHIMKHKRMTVKQWREERKSERRCQEQSSQDGKKSSTIPKTVTTGLNPEQEIKLLRRLFTPIDGLASYGYVSSIPTDEDITKAREGIEAADGWEKCDRCTKRFQVFPGRRDEDGALTSGGTCTHHWGKMYVPERPPGEKTRVPKRYRCCGQEIGDSAGCAQAKHHVFKVSDPKRLAAILNYAETPANPGIPSDRVVCFDCEMCYTVNGLELVRLTATSWPGGDELLDVLVLPLGQILDLNSRFSGVWPEDLAQAEPWKLGDDPKSTLLPQDASSSGHTPKKKLKSVSSPQVARDLLFSLISPDTPLVGHGLENDLNAIRIVHPTLIDTVLLHPHKFGLPYRHGLKMLMDRLLNRQIQVETGDDVRGHDSLEDARAAGELVHLKVMEKWQEMRHDGWTLDGDTGDFVPPKLTAEYLETRS